MAFASSVLSASVGFDLLSGARCAFCWKQMAAGWERASNDSFGIIVRTGSPHSDPSTEVKVFATGQRRTAEHGVNALTFRMIRNHALHNLALNTKWGYYCSVSWPWRRRWFVYMRIREGWTCAGISNVNLKCHLHGDVCLPKEQKRFSHERSLFTRP